MEVNQLHALLRAELLLACNSTLIPSLWQRDQHAASWRISRTFFRR